MPHIHVRLGTGSGRGRRVHIPIDPSKDSIRPLTTVLTGFVVVLRNPPVVADANPSYRGLDRLRPWDPELEARLPPGLTDCEGFARTLEDARTLRDYYAAKTPDNFEIIWANLLGEPVSDSRAARQGEWDFAGHDVAGLAPFYSIVGDPPATSLRTWLQSRLNSFGLLDSPREAAEYRRLYAREEGEPEETFYGVWEVNFVPG